MKKIHYLIICLLIIGAWAVGYFNQYYRAPIIEEVQVQVLKEIINTDTLYIDKIVEKKILVPKYITETKIDTLEVIKEVIIEKPIEVIKKVYVDKPYETIVDRYVLPESKWYLGFGYKFDNNNFFSGTDIKLVHKFKSDKMFSLDAGLRNDLLDTETGLSKVYPYIGASIYFRIDNKK